jgi:hypothetical protein
VHISHTVLLALLAYVHVSQCHMSAPAVADDVPPPLPPPPFNG